MKTRYSWLFALLTIALSFAAYLLPVPRILVTVLMVLIPTLVALPLAWITEGGPAVRAILSQVVNLKVPLRWYAAAIGLGLFVRLATSVLALALGSISSIQVRPWNAFQMAGFFVALFIFALLEEIGWRGYFLPRLLRRFSPLLSALIVGVLWGSVHLALHLPGMDLAGLHPAATLLQLVSASVLITWLYVNTSSLFLTSLLHASQSFFVILNEGILPAQQYQLFTIVYVLTAILLVIVGRGVMLPRRPDAKTASGYQGSASG